MKSLQEIPHCLHRERLSVRAVIETPAGSKAKLAFDAAAGTFRVSRLLPVGLAMPLDFGFVPSTRAGDGDPLDIMSLSEADLPTGCIATVRLLGAIEVEQRVRNADAKPERNDRLIARLVDSRRFAELRELEQLGSRFVNELNRFFETYKDVRGEDYRVLAVSGPARAADLIEQWGIQAS